MLKRLISIILLIAIASVLVGFQFNQQAVYLKKKKKTGAASGGGGGNIPAFVQSTGAQGVTTISATITAGNTLYVLLYDRTNANQTDSITSTLGNTITTGASLCAHCVANLATDGDTVNMACGPITTGGAETLTFKNSGTATAMTAVLFEVSGAACTIDTSATPSNVATTTTCSAGPATTSFSNDFLITGCATSNGETFTVGAGWSHLSLSNAGGHAAGEVIVGTNSAGSFTGTMTYGTSGENTTLMVAFKHT